MASLPLPVSASTYSAMMEKPSISANRAMVPRWASIPRPERCCRCVESPCASLHLGLDFCKERPQEIFLLGLAEADLRLEERRESIDLVDDPTAGWIDEMNSRVSVVIAVIADRRTPIGWNLAKLHVCGN
jgi:hypothetical protein